MFNVGRSMFNDRHQASSIRAKGASSFILHPSSFILSSIPYIPRSEYPISAPQALPLSLHAKN